MEIKSDIETMLKPKLHQESSLLSAGFAGFENPKKNCLRRIHNDLSMLYREPIEGIIVVPDDNRVNRCHAAVMGPSETPYEFGFFYFVLDFPDGYPIVPPKVTLQTTGGGSTRFNPNLYACGKVCLSILNTWSGPSWTPALTIGSLLLSVQSLMNAIPYHNEPGFENINVAGPEPRNYNHIIRHETIRVAVLEMLELAKRNKIPATLAELMIDTFQVISEFCKIICEEYTYLDGTPFKDPYNFNKGTFAFCKLKEQLHQLETELRYVKS